MEHFTHVLAAYETRTDHRDLMLFPPREQRAPVLSTKRGSSVLDIVAYSIYV